MLFLISLLFLLLGKQAFGNNESDTNVNYAFVAGRVFPPDDQLSTSWLLETDVHLKGAIQKGFIREDGSFVFTNVPPGSYIVEVTNPSYYYEPVRVEINSKGKIRARKVNYIQTSQVLHVPYPLKMKPFSPIRYFQIREQWRIIDFLFNPMVSEKYFLYCAMTRKNGTITQKTNTLSPEDDLNKDQNVGHDKENVFLKPTSHQTASHDFLVLMMVLPLLLVMLLPRVMNDPEAKKEMEQFNNLTKYDMPEMSEMITSFFGGGNQPKPRAIKQSKKSSKANS